MEAALGVPPRAGAGAGVADALAADAAAGVSAIDVSDRAVGSVQDALACAAVVRIALYRSILFCWR